MATDTRVIRSRVVYSNSRGAETPNLQIQPRILTILYCCSEIFILGHFSPFLRWRLALLILLEVLVAIPRPCRGKPYIEATCVNFCMRVQASSATSQDGNGLVLPHHVPVRKHTSASKGPHDHNTYFQRRVTRDIHMKFHSLIGRMTCSLKPDNVTTLLVCIKK
jgi:hypothetical protein